MVLTYQFSNFKSLGCQEPHQRHPYPPSPGWILGGHLGSWRTFLRYLMVLRCQFSNFNSLGCQEPCQGQGVMMLGSVEDRSLGGVVLHFQDGVYHIWHEFWHLSEKSSLIHFFKSKGEVSHPKLQKFSIVHYYPLTLTLPVNERTEMKLEIYLSEAWMCSELDQIWSQPGM